jgi:hypothetical protein
MDQAGKIKRCGILQTMQCLPLQHLVKTKFKCYEKLLLDFFASYKFTSCN